MKKFFLLTILSATYFIEVQSQECGIKVLKEYQFQKSKGDSLTLNISLYIINCEAISYYYPKAIEQNRNDNTLSHSFKFLKYHASQDLSFDVASAGYNSYDTCIIISPNDTLILKYSDIPISAAKQEILISGYIFSDLSAIKEIGMWKYLDRFKRGTKKMEYKFSYQKNCSKDFIKIANYPQKNMEE